MGARRYHVSRTIEAPATTVWRLLTEPDGYADWNDAVVSLSGDITPGGSVELVSIADPKRTFKLKVAELDAPNRMVWSSGMPFGLFTGRRTYTVTESGDQRCEFEMTEDFGGPLAGLVTKAIPDLTDSFETFADSLSAAATAG